MFHILERGRVLIGESEVQILRYLLSIFKKRGGFHLGKPEVKDQANSCLLYSRTRQNHKERQIQKLCTIFCISERGKVTMEEPEVDLALLSVFCISEHGKVKTE